jgi:hypothetical protein
MWKKGEKKEQKHDEEEEKWCHNNFSQKISRWQNQNDVKKVAYRTNQSNIVWEISIKFGTLK